MNTSVVQNQHRVEHADIARPGRALPSFLVIFFDPELSAAVHTLKAHFSSAAGTVEEALEYAVKRTNDLAEGREISGSIVALAYEDGQFAVSGGGEIAAHLCTRHATVDVSPASTSITREKCFAAFTAGSAMNGTFIVSLRKLKSDELARFRTVHHGAQRIQFVTKEVMRVSPLASETVISSAARYYAQARAVWMALLDRHAWQHALTECISMVRHPQQFSAAVQANTSKFFYWLAALFKKSTPKKRIGAIAIIVAAAVLLNAFFSVLGARTVEEIIAETLKNDTRITELIQQKKETHALALLDETLLLLAKAPTKLNDTQQETLASLQAKLLRTAADLNKVSIIPSPQTVVSMEKSFREARQFDLSGLALAGAKLYTVNRAEKEVYELDGKGRRIVILKDFPEGAGVPTGIVASVPGLVMVTTENPRGVLALNIATRKFAFAPLTLPRKESQPVSFASFNEKVYLLDARTRAIYRYELTPQGFDLWSAWSDDDTLDFSQATTFAVDGSIYVTFSDHDIVKLTQGKKEAFAVETIRPPLEKVTAIATKENSPFLYLLDPPQRRVVIIAKANGALVAQYTSPFFDDLRGLFPDEQAKRIYLLNGDTVYSVGPEDESLIDQLSRK